MSPPDLKPLSAGELDDFERALLDSVTDDAAPDEGRKETLAALGLAASTTIASTPKRASLTKQVWSDLSKVKLVALSVVAIGSGFAITEFASRVTPASSVDATPRQAQTAPVPNAPVPSSAITLEPPPPEPSAHEPTPPRTSSVAPRPPASAEVAIARSAATAASTLTREIAIIEAARSELARGRTTASLARLDAYDEEFPRGAFSVEVAALRIDAMSREGRAAEVERLAAAFLSAYPTGIYTRRVEEARARARATRQDDDGAHAPERGER